MTDIKLFEDRGFYCLDFHRQSKLSYQEVREEPYLPNWNDFPNPFRSYEGSNMVLLQPATQIPENNINNCLKNLQLSPENKNLNLEEISELLRLSLGINAWKKMDAPPYQYALRSNPSCGNLHPIEAYLCLNTHNQYHGYYHYNTLNHTLEKRYDLSLLTELSKATGYEALSEASGVVILSSVDWRQCWKYRLRGLRYVWLDAAHAAMNTMIAAANLGLSASLIANFPDQTVKEIMGLGQLSEFPMLMIVLGTKLKTWRYPTLKPEEIPNPHDFLGIPNSLYEQAYLFNEIEQLKMESNLDIADLRPPLCTQHPNEYTYPSLPPEHFSQLATQRRSALGFIPKGKLKKSEFQIFLQILNAQFHADFLGSIFGHRRTSFLSYYFFIHRVEGLNSGVYHYNSQTGTLERMAEGNFQHECSYLHLEQKLCGDAMLTLCMVANFNDAIKVFQERGYRLCFTEAGLLGQLLYMISETLGYRGCGIGAFYDEELNRYLRLLSNGHQVIYSFSLGLPAHDPRPQLTKNET